MDEKTFLVTGASRDIGRAVAERLGGHGSFGILHQSSAEGGASRTLSAVRETGGDGVVLTADFRDGAAVAKFLDEVEAALGARKLNTLVLNAAFTSPSPIGAADLAALEAMLAVNVLAPQRIVDRLAPHLADNGAIVALSIAAVRQVFSPDFGFFSATKGAVNVLIPAWAVAFGGRGIRVNAVAPGVVDANFRSELLKDDGFRAALEGATALGRPGRIDDIADVVAFLASDDARWITGQVIDSSGGWKL